MDGRRNHRGGLVVGESERFVDFCIEMEHRGFGLDLLFSFISLLFEVELLEFGEENRRLADGGDLRLRYSPGHPLESGYDVGHLLV